MSKHERASEPAPSQPHRRRRRLARYLLLAIGVVLIVDAFVGDRGLVAMLKARQEYRLLDASLAHARAENARLREEARRLREDAGAVEEIARRELGLIRPGEKLFIIKDITPGQIPDDSAPAPQSGN